MPFVVCAYYIYIESWTLGYAIYALAGELPKISPNAVSADEIQKPFKAFFLGYTGFGANSFLNQPTIWAYLIFLLPVG